jgi:hypothetical protein
VATRKRESEPECRDPPQLNPRSEGGRPHQRWDTSHASAGDGPEPVANGSRDRGLPRSRCGIFREARNFPTTMRDQDGPSPTGETINYERPHLFYCGVDLHTRLPAGLAKASLMPPKRGDTARRTIPAPRASSLIDSDRIE